MKILSINNFTTRLLSKLLSDLYIGVHLKGTEKFGSKVINRQFFHRKTIFNMKILSISNLTTKLISIKDCFLNRPHRKIAKMFTKKLSSKFINIQYFHGKTGL
jgi:hypothetical protein